MQQTPQYTLSCRGYFNTYFNSVVGRRSLLCGMVNSGFYPPFPLPPCFPLFISVMSACVFWGVGAHGWALTGFANHRHSLHLVNRTKLYFSQKILITLSV